MQKLTNLSIEDIERIAAKAVTDNAALDELGKINEALGRRLNARMRRLEKAGETSGAYKSIKSTIGGTRASQAHTGSAEGLLRSIEKTKKALKYKRGTFGGIKDTAAKELTSLKIEATKENIDYFHELGKIGALNEFKKAFGGSSFFTELRDAVQSGSDLEDLYNAYKAMQEGVKTDVFKIWDKWTKQ